MAENWSPWPTLSWRRLWWSCIDAHPFYWRSDDCDGWAVIRTGRLKRVFSSSSSDQTWMHHVFSSGLVLFQPKIRLDYSLVMLRRVQFECLQLLSWYLSRINQLFHMMVLRKHRCFYVVSHLQQRSSVFLDNMIWPAWKLWDFLNIIKTWITTLATLARNLTENPASF